MTKTVGKVVIATLLFGAVHSILASTQVKRAVSAAIGERRRNAFYRPFYIAQSLLSVAFLFSYLKKLPDKSIYVAPSPISWLMNALRMRFIVMGWGAAREIGLARLTGWRNLSAWRRGDGAIPVEPEAQGPAPDADGMINRAGPFRYSRHPLNFIGVPLFWLAPRLTRNRVIFNIVASLYLFAGSRHEESRLREAYGEAYERYRSSQSSFFLPRDKKFISAPDH